MPFGLDDPQKQQAALFTLLLLGGAYLFWQYVYSPLHQERVAVEDRLSTLQAYNDQARALTQPGRVAELRRREAEYQVALATYETMLPSQAEVSALLEDVARAALQEDVSVVSFLPQDPVSGPNLVELPYDVQIQGDYHAIGRFLADVANLPRLVRPVVASLESVEVTTQEGDHTVTNYQVLATMKLSTFIPPEGSAVGVSQAHAGETSMGRSAEPRRAADAAKESPDAG